MTNKENVIYNRQVLLSWWYILVQRNSAYSDIP